MKTYKQLLFIIFDGWGYSEEKKYNAIYQANPKFFNSLWQNYPHTLLKASGEALGLPEGQIGTSEIAHLTIGAGTVINTDLVRVNKNIKDNNLKDNPVLIGAFNHAKKYNSTLHFIGMVSPGGVHSHQDHLFAMLRAAKQAGVTNVVVHAFTDGRDKPPMSAEEYLNNLQSVLDEIGIGRIASITGRYYAMDRDTNWDRTQLAFDALFKGEGRQYQNKSIKEIIAGLYAQNETDEFFKPIILLDDAGKPNVIQQNDSVFFFNFRPDRARQLTYKIVEVGKEMNLYFATLSEYDDKLKVHVAFPTLEIKTTLAAEISKAGLTQVHIAETEKYAHLTYFLNGEKEEPYEKEDRVLIPSQKVATHDLAPEMRAKEIADTALEYIEKGTNVIMINFANADMVGHLGNLPATIQAIKVLDIQLERIVTAMEKRGGVTFITADHGNAEQQYDEKIGQKHTAHTLNPVPAILTDKSLRLHEGALADVAPTLLQILGLPKPEAMTGKSLIES